MVIRSLREFNVWDEKLTSRIDQFNVSCSIFELLVK